MALSLNPRAFAKLQEQPSQAYPIVIRETTGPGRQVVLQGRSLPYRGVAWEGEQRMEVKWYPGSPVGSAQVLGPKYMPTQMEGMWKDAFLASEENRAKLFNFPPVAAAARAARPRSIVHRPGGRGAGAGPANPADPLRVIGLRARRPP